MMVGLPVTGEFDARLSTAAIRQCHSVDQPVDLDVQSSQQPGRAGEHRTRAIVKPGGRGGGLSDVASYGKQLGRIEDALLVLLAHFHPERELTADEQKALSDLKAIATDVAAVKTKHRRRTAS
jgi:hypothetical protein